MENSLDKNNEQQARYDKLFYDRKLLDQQINGNKLLNEQTNNLNKLSETMTKINNIVFDPLITQLSIINKVMPISNIYESDNNTKFAM